MEKAEFDILIRLKNSFDNMLLFEFHNLKYITNLHNVISKDENNIYYKFYTYYKLSQLHDMYKPMPEFITDDELKIFNSVMEYEGN